MSCCPLRKCQGKRGCLCPSKPPPFIYSKTTDKEPSVQEHIPITSTNDIKRRTPKYIGENSPVSPPVTRVKNSPNKTSRPQDNKNKSVKAITAKLPQSDAKVDDVIDKSASTELKQDNTADSKADDEGAELKNGNVKINYNHYKKDFIISNGSIASDIIDSEYCLTFAFPKCKIHLSTYSPNDFSYEDNGLSAPPLEKESPPGTYQELRTDQVYWVHLEEDQEELEAYHKRQDKYAEEAAAKRKEDEENEARGIVSHSGGAESCSCIEGNPCMDRYGCKDWDNRYEVAKRNGWKGF